MPEPVGSGAAHQVEARRDVVRQPDILEDLDALAEAKNVELGMMSGEPGKDRLRIAADRENGMAAVRSGRASWSKGATRTSASSRPRTCARALLQG